MVEVHSVLALSANEFKPASLRFLQQIMSGMREDVLVRLFKEGGGSLNGKNFTLGDLPFTAGQARNRFEAFFEANPEILGDKNSFELLSQSLLEAERFLREYLLLQVPRGMQQHIQKGFKGAEDVYTFLDKTIAGRGGRGGYSPYYCALAKLTRTILESKKQSFEALASFLNYYNFKKPLKSLKRIAPYDFVLKKWKENPKLFLRDPTHHCVGLNI